MLMNRSPVAMFSHCWKCSNFLLIVSALSIAFFKNQATIIVGRLADIPKARGTSMPMLLEMLRGIIIPK